MTSGILKSMCSDVLTVREIQQVIKIQIWPEHRLVLTTSLPSHLQDWCLTTACIAHTLTTTPALLSDRNYDIIRAGPITDNLTTVSLTTVHASGDMTG